jgi:hypothetical protein
LFLDTIAPNKSHNTDQNIDKSVSNVNTCNPRDVTPQISEGDVENKHPDRHSNGEDGFAKSIKSRTSDLDDATSRTSPFSLKSLAKDELKIPKAIAQIIKIGRLKVIKHPTSWFILVLIKACSIRQCMTEI